jgi:hypothetical protein
MTASSHRSPANARLDPANARATSLRPVTSHERPPLRHPRRRAPLPALALAQVGAPESRSAARLFRTTGERVRSGARDACFDEDKQPIGLGVAPCAKNQQRRAARADTVASVSKNSADMQARLALGTEARFGA